MTHCLLVSYTVFVELKYSFSGFNKHSDFHNLNQGPLAYEVQEFSPFLRPNSTLLVPQRITAFSLGRPIYGHHNLPVTAPSHCLLPSLRILTN